VATTELTVEFLAQVWPGIEAEELEAKNVDLV
jgi:hypothetical protein